MLDNIVADVYQVEDSLQKWGLSWLVRVLPTKEVVPVTDDEKRAWLHGMVEQRRKELGRPVYTELIRDNKGTYPLPLPLSQPLPDMLLHVYAVPSQDHVPDSTPGTFRCCHIYS